MTEAKPIRTTRVVLLGMMGSGKSSVGRALADLTGWPFVDNDALVQAATGRTARQILAEAGEDAMRAAEGAALSRGLAVEPPAIVATAAGTVLEAEQRRLIDEGGFVVWLTATPEVLATRASGAAHRPWLEHDPAAWFEEAAATRNPLYRSISDLEIDTERLQPPDAARRILDAMSASG